MKPGLSIVRDTFTDHSTIGKLYLDGVFLCDTLEDTCRNVKVDRLTAVPAGCYDVVIDMSTRFKRLMPHILKVPFFDGVRIHGGNTDEDTDGCILVGLRDIKFPDFIGHSQDSFHIIVFPKIEEALKKGPLAMNIYGGFSTEDFEFAKKMAG